MYEGQTQEVIQSRMLGNVSSEVDKREGSIIFDAVAPASIEFFLLYVALDYFYRNTFGDTANREWLIRRAKERGLTPKPASSAMVRAVFTPSTLNVPIGSTFSYESVNYTVSKKVADGEYLLLCDMTGIEGNKTSGRLIPNEYIVGLQSANLAGVVVPGEDEEDTETFRARYLSSFDGEAYGGNIADYKDKVNAISGVGGCKVYPVWNGGGTVRLVFMTSEFKPPTKEFVDKVQTLIDPVANSGEGIGIAPIGHHVTVEGVRNSAVAIELHIALASGREIGQYRTNIERLIDDYFVELNKTWQSTKVDTAESSYNGGLIIRTSRIESHILSLDGVDDVAHTKLNGIEENLELRADELAVRGEITWIAS